MKLTGLHLLLTYQCNFECDHCFVWGSPRQSGTFSMACILEVLRQAEALGTVQSIYFEGGEPFLYYPVLIEGVRQAAQRGFQVGVVSNAYWATNLEDAILWLKPLTGLLDDLSVSSDLFHYDEIVSRQSIYAKQAAEKCGIPLGVISVAQPQADGVQPAVGQLPEEQSGVMYRGRAAVKLAGSAPQKSYESFTTCPFEDLRDPGRVHIDPFGNLHICQGIVIGNLFKSPLTEICAAYDPEAHPITGPLLAGGPRLLAECYNIQPQQVYADACQMCYQTRLELRHRSAEAALFSSILLPDQVYGLAA